MSDDTAQKRYSELTDEERRQLHYTHLNAISAQRTKVDKENDFLKTLRKKAKADGLILADVDFHLRLLAVEDDSIIPAELQRRVDIMRWAGMPVNFQDDLFADRRPANEKAYEEGKAASARGVTAKIPPEYENDQGLGQAWMKGHGDDQEERRRIMKDSMDAKNAEKAAAKKGKGKADPPMKGDGPKTAAAKKGAAAKPAKNPRTAADPVTGETVVPFSQAMRDANAPVDKALKTGTVPPTH